MSIVGFILKLHLVAFPIDLKKKEFWNAISGPAIGAIHFQFLYKLFNSIFSLSFYFVGARTHNFLYLLKYIKKPSTIRLFMLGTRQLF